MPGHPYTPTPLHPNRTEEAGVREETRGRTDAGAMACGGRGGRQMPRKGAEPARARAVAFLCLESVVRVHCTPAQAASTCRDVRAPARETPAGARGGDAVVSSRVCAVALLLRRCQATPPASQAKCSRAAGRGVQRFAGVANEVAGPPVGFGSGRARRLPWPPPL